MHTLIDKTLQKQGIKSVDDLTPEEKAVYDRYSKILSTEEVTSSQIADLCRSQRFLIEGKFDIDNTPEKAKYLELQFMVYTKILNLIEGPKAERESLIKHLESQLDAPSS